MWTAIWSVPRAELKVPIRRHTVGSDQYGNYLKVPCNDTCEKVNFPSLYGETLPEKRSMGERPSIQADRGQETAQHEHQTGHPSL
jgi:hypothetical protein